MIFVFPSPLARDALREVKGTFSRFFSIFAIMALGVGFFAGVQATGRDMRLTADDYFDSHRLMDAHVISDLGLSEGDVDAIREIPGVSGVLPSYFTDVIALSQDNFLVRVHSLPQLSQDSPDALNQPRLIEGRLPESPGECLADSVIQEMYGFGIGRSITLASGKSDEDISETLVRNSFEIVGIVESPMYIDMTKRGNTTIGNGSLDAFLLIPEENFVLDCYTDIFMTYAPATEAAVYTSAYDEASQALIAALEELELTRAPARLKEIQEEAQREIDDAQRELDDGILEMEEKLAEAEQKIADAEQKLLDGEEEYRQGLSDYEREIGKAQQELDDARAQLDDGYEQLREARQELEDGQEELDKGKSALRQAEAGYLLLEENLVLMSDRLGQIPDALPGFDAGVPADQIPGLQQLVAALNENFSDADGQSLGFGELLVVPVEIPNPVPGGEPIIMECVTPDSKQAVLDALEGYRQGVALQLEEARAEIADAEEYLAWGRKEFQENRRLLEKAKEEYEEGLAEFEQEKAKAEQELADAQQKIADGRVELEDGKAEYEEKKADAEAQVADARQKLDDARQELADLELPEWIIQNREDYLPAYGNFGDDAHRIDNVAAVFPVFFLAVAALVCLTTMTRMVEEQRVQIGTCKALGYSGAAIVSKFLAYAVTASLLGSLLGLVVGFRLFPTVIYNAYCILYDMPPAMAPFHTVTGFWACLAAVACSALVTVAACGSELRETPAQLMRPKAPKAGRRVLLERIPILWNRLSFIQKVTVRNLFRYKKRVLMTVTGIAGCTALMLTGFGLNDAITDIVRNQYVDIFRYDLMILYDSDTQDPGEIRQAVAGSEGISAFVEQSIQSMTAMGENGKQLDVNVTALSDPAAIGSFITLRDRISHDPVEIQPDGAVVTEMLATLLELSPGDSLSLRDPDGSEHRLIVSGIAENYSAHFLYVTPEYYRQVFGEAPEYNCFLANLTDPSLENAVAEELLKLEDVLAVSPTSVIKAEFGNISDNFKFVVVVLIVSAGLLAFVVLYNLTNINITERIREIATLKVLGFFDGEVSAYIYRENIALTVLGTAAGLFLGLALTKFVVVTAEIDDIMFGRNVYPLSYGIAAALTLVFAMLVNLAMIPRLRRISMVESMKSVD